jgi:hypothetical protein
MKKTYGVCVGMLAMGLAVLGAPVSRAQSRMAAGSPSAASESGVTSTTSATSPAAELNSADLNQSKDALKKESAGVNTEIAASKGETLVAAADTTSPDAGSPDQSSSAPSSAPQAAASAAAAPAPLPTPAMSGPLATGIPHELPAGPFGKIEVTGILSGIGLFSNNPFNTGDEGHEDVSNAQVFIQKTSGWFQFYLQGGAYNLPVVGVIFAKTTDTVSGTFGPFPVGYIKLVKGNFSAEVGKLPTLIGDEFTFTFENMNIERGLLWNQEPAISRGIQLNDSYKKLSVAFSWNDGLYSNRFTTLSGLLSYAINGSNTITFAASGNAGVYGKNEGATFVYQNNQQIYNVIYTFTKGPLTISPYYQYTNVKSADNVYGTGAHTNSGAILANYNFKHGISLSFRPEYIKSSGSVATGEANLLGYGSGTGAFSFTVTPTYVKDAFFIRGDVSVVHLTNFAPGADAGFGIGGTSTNQFRGAIEAGFMF